MRSMFMPELKGDPAGAPFGYLRSSDKIGRLRNSHEPLRGHVLKQCSPFFPILSPALSAPEGGEKPEVSISLPFPIKARAKATTQ